MYTKCYLENLIGRNHLGDMNVDGIVLKYWYGLNLTGCRRVQWWVLVNTVMNLWVP
jgi:hypothetical protein